MYNHTYTRIIPLSCMYIYNKYETVTINKIDASEYGFYIAKCSTSLSILLIRWAVETVSWTIRPNLFSYIIITYNQYSFITIYNAIAYYSLFLYNKINDIIYARLPIYTNIVLN